MKFSVEVTVFDALGEKLRRDREKALRGLGAVAAALKDPERVFSALYQVAVRLGISFVVTRVREMMLPIRVEPVYDPAGQHIIGFRLVSHQPIPQSTVSELVDRFLEGFGEALRQLVEGA